MPSIVLARLRKPCKAWITPHAITLQGPASGNELLRIPLNFGNTPEKSLEHACAQLVDAWKKAGWQHRTLQVMLPDYWIRPLVLAVTAAPVEHHRALQLLQAQYRRIYGDAMQAWTITWHQIDDQLISMACPTGAIDLLKHGLMQSNSLLTAISPLSIPILKTFPDFDVDYLVLCIYDRAMSIVRIEKNKIVDWSNYSADAVDCLFVSAQLQRYQARKADSCRNVKIVDISRKINTSDLSHMLDSHQWNHDTIGLNQLWHGGVGDWFRLVQNSVS